MSGRKRICSGARASLTRRRTRSSHWTVYYAKLINPGFGGTTWSQRSSVSILARRSESRSRRNTARPVGPASKKNKPFTNSVSMCMTNETALVQIFALSTPDAEDQNKYSSTICGPPLTRKSVPSELACWVQFLPVIASQWHSDIYTAYELLPWQRLTSVWRGGFFQAISQCQLSGEKWGYESQTRRSQFKLCGGWTDELVFDARVRSSYIIVRKKFRCDDAWFCWHM